MNAATAARAMAALLEPFRQDLERRELDLDAVAVALADAAEAALHWYALMELREATPLLKQRDAAIRRFQSAARDFRRLCKDERVMRLGPEVLEALGALDRLLDVQPKQGDRTVVVKKAWPGLASFATATYPPEGMPAHRAPKPWKRTADRALAALDVPQDVRRELIAAIDSRARQ